MIILTYDQVLPLKQAVSDHFDNYVHFHDGCGAQSFELETPSKEAEAFVVSYFEPQGIAAVFHPDHSHFRLEEA
ncbi:MAG: hypothetical protein IJ133_05885 [Clostridia bacterium]|nr:hypothetical protein [Clostridia bacterium]